MVVLTEMEPLKNDTFVPSQQPAQLPPEGDTAHHALPLRTLSSDLAEAVREQQGSAIKIAIAEDERRTKERDAASPASKKNLTFIFGGIIVVIIAVGGISAALWYRHESQLAVPLAAAPVVSSIIRSDATGTMDITGQTQNEITNEFQAMIANPGIGIGTVKNVLVTQGGTGANATRVPANQFLSAIGAHITPAFSRSLGQDYMLGMYFYDHTNGFLVLTGTAHDYLLSGMLAW